MMCRLELKRKERITPPHQSAVKISPMFWLSLLKKCSLYYDYFTANTREILISRIVS